jgi:hypothetical protein
VVARTRASSTMALPSVCRSDILQTLPKILVMCVGLLLLLCHPGEQSSRLVDEQSRVLHPDKVRAAAAVTHEVHRIAL